MIHGNARIKLYNPISGNVIKEIEKENTFIANNIANYIKDMGTARNGYYPNWTKTVGGILCFRDAIQGTPQFMPNTNRMVANAAYGIANTGNPVELGSYNENESIIGGDSITQVYDWNLSQGNGTINCIALTSQDGGYCGYGNLSGQRKTDREFAANTRNATSGEYPYGFVFGEILYRPELSGNTLYIHRKPICVSKYNIFNNLDLADDVFDLTEVGTIDGFYISYPASGVMFINMMDVGDGKIAIVADNQTHITVQAGGTIGYYEYDTINHTLTKKTFTNSSGKTVQASQYSGRNFFITKDGYAFVPTDTVSTYYYEIIRISDSAFIGEVLTTTDQSLLSFGGCNILTNRSYHANMSIFLDDKSTPLPINATGYGDASVYMTNGDDSSFTYKNFSGGSGQSFLLKNPLYLATICNLDSPVTKTASMAMKIIYTLTEAS